MALISSTSAISHHYKYCSRIFSRLSASKTYSVDQSSEEEEPERNELIIEMAIEEMFNEVTKALALQHSFMYETYNICEIVGDAV